MKTILDYFNVNDIRDLGKSEKFKSFVVEVEEANNDKIKKYSCRSIGAVLILYSERFYYEFTLNVQKTALLIAYREGVVHKL